VRGKTRIFTTIKLDRQHKTPREIEEESIIIVPDEKRANDMYDETIIITTTTTTTTKTFSNTSFRAVVTHTHKRIQPSLHIHIFFYL